MKIIKRLALIVVVAIWISQGILQIIVAVQLRTLMPLLLATESILVGYRLLHRRQSTENPHPWFIRAAIIFSIFLAPMMLRVERSVSLLVTLGSSIGLMLTIWALWSLGASFGIAPANRGLVTHGPYRFIRHPMYTGELINYSMVVLWNPSTWNLVLLGVIISFLFIRIRLEERTVHDYDQYATRVRWRIVPYVW